MRKRIVFILTALLFIHFALADWASPNSSSCYNISIDNNYTQDNRVLLVNLTSLTFSNITEIRIYDLPCYGNSTDNGTEVKSTILSNNSDWAYTTFLANLTEGGANFSVYFNDPTDPEKSADLEACVDFCEFDGGACGWNATGSIGNFTDEGTINVSGATPFNTWEGYISPLEIGNTTGLITSRFNFITQNPVTTPSAFSYFGLTSARGNEMFGTTIPMSAISLDLRASIGEDIVLQTYNGSSRTSNTIQNMTYKAYIQKYANGDVYSKVFNEFGTQLGDTFILGSYIPDNLSLAIGVSGDAWSNQIMYDYLRAYVNEAEYVSDADMPIITLGTEETKNYSVYLTSPLNGTYSSENKDFTCEVFGAIELSNITLWIWNSSGDIYNNTEEYDLTGTSVTQTFNTMNFTYSDTFYWNCIAESLTDSAWGNENHTLFVDTSTPIITQNYPSNNSWINNNTIEINCTVEGNELDSAFLFVNGTDENYTLLGITSGIVNSFNLTVPGDGQYTYTCGANKTIDDTIYHSQYGNYTFNTDTAYPTGGNLTITTTVVSQTIQFLTDVSDSNLDYCKYSIRNSTDENDGTNNNITFTCNSLTSATTTAYGDFILFTYAYDLAGNMLEQNLSFTTSPSTGGTIQGGGGNPTIISNPNWTMTTDTGSKAYSIETVPGFPIKKTLLFQNMGADNLTINIRCEGELCDYMIFENESILLPIGVTNIPESSFAIDLPLNVTSKSLEANIIATDELQGANVVTVKVGIGGFFGFIISTFRSLTNPFLLLMFAGVWIFTSFFMILLLKKKSWGLSVGILIGLMFGSLSLILNTLGVFNL